MTVAIMLYVLIAGRAELFCEPYKGWQAALVSYTLGWFMIPARILAKLAQ